MRALPLSLSPHVHPAGSEQICGLFNAESTALRLFVYSDDKPNWEYRLNRRPEHAQQTARTTSTAA